VTIKSKSPAAEKQEYHATRSNITVCCSDHSHYSGL